MDYKNSGVDIEAGYKSVELMKKYVKETMRPEVLGGLGGFSGAFSLAAIKDMEEPVLLSGTDGCGTKVKLAFLLDKHDTIGIDAVAVDQWRTYSHRKYGNSVAPLLISKQGYNKSTFCRSLVPPELQWGYNDNLVLSEKRQVLQAMCQSLVINLDEFNQISPQVQQGFLKNIIQLPSVKIKPPYGSHVQEFPRMASFIATSNMEDILSDPSGNRRFLGVELTGPINVSQLPNYEQLYAQALSALRAGEKTYFDAEQTRQIMANNRKFEVVSPVDQYFDLYFDLTDDAEQGEYLTAAEIFQELKSHIGSSLKLNSLIAFGRKLSQMPTIHRKRFNDGMRYLVVRKS